MKFKLIQKENPSNHAAPNANYKLSITTQFSGSERPLKTVHTVVYDAVLVVA